MAYTAWSVVFGEQPTAAKWNQLGANDAGFRDGTNINNGAIKGNHLDFSTFGATVYGSPTGYTLLTTNQASYTTYGSSNTFNLRAGQVIIVIATRASSLAGANNSVRVTGTAFTSPPDDQSMSANDDGNSRSSNVSYVVADQAGTCTVQGSYQKPSSGNLYARWQVIVLP